MSHEIASLMKELTPDPRRLQLGFSPELHTTLSRVLNPAADDRSVEQNLNEWIARNQPCLFGRIAAKQNAITYCILRDSQIDGTDEGIEEAIQDARLEWTRRGFEGHSSNFVIAVLSQRLVDAEPNAVLKQIALRIASLYLQETIEADRIYTDRIYLEQPGSSKATWEWLAGVNYFAANGDKRWWQDHRFPSGIAFSVNSVGHLVKSGKMLAALNFLEQAMGTAVRDFKTSKVDSLERALEFAMRTINLASESLSGKATFLKTLSPGEGPSIGCPVELPAILQGRDYCTYGGYYHTDVTIPSEYFVPTDRRPTTTRARDLDFTYLFDAKLDNPDFDRMGSGRMIRATDDVNVPRVVDSPHAKRLRGVGTSVQIASAERLSKALRRR